MKIALGSDHRGFESKEMLEQRLADLDHEIIDLGCEGTGSCDYPDHALAVAKAVAAEEVDRGILLCGSGIGMSIAANKVRGIRAALCHDELMGEMSRRHNNANVLCLPADFIDADLIGRIVEVWLRTEYEGGRHDRRLGKIHAYEADPKG